MTQGRIILIRHGETEANCKKRFAESDEIPLTDIGREQARQLALRLAREFRPTVLFSSGYARARQTSEIIANTLNLNPEILAGVHERDFGCLKGHPYERMGEIISLDALYNPEQSWMWSPEGGESLHDVRLRAVAALENLRILYADREVVVVCHGAVIQALCAHITGDWSAAQVVPNCAIVVLEHTAEGWKNPAVFHPIQMHE